jgi:hypothetical protein
MFRFLICAFVLMIPAAARAENNTLTGNPGFFKPTPDGDVAITKIVPPAEVTPNTAPSPAPSAVGSPPQAADPLAAERKAIAREAEDEIERAEQRHEKEAEKSVQSATRIEGAFTGLTSERDR